MAVPIDLEIIKIQRETENAYTYFLQPLTKKTIQYQAGQFLTVMLQRNEIFIRRSYSFSSTPEVDEQPAITIKEVQNGEVSRYLLKTLCEHSVISVLKPAGIFTLETDPGWQRDLFFIAAGSGITPVFSLMKKLLYTEPRSHCILILQNSSKRSIIFNSALEKLQKTYQNNFTWINLLSRPETGQHPQRLNISLLELLILNQSRFEKEKTLFYTCGPRPFMRMVEFTVRTAGFAADQIRQENFVVDQPPTPSFYIDDSPRNIIIHMNDNIYRFSVIYPKTILQAALDHSIDLPYSCRGGRCSTCVARCVKGSMKMSINEVLTEKDLQKGLVLPCVGFAETDIELEYDLVVG